MCCTFCEHKTRTGCVVEDQPSFPWQTFIGARIFASTRVATGRVFVLPTHAFDVRNPSLFDNTTKKQVAAHTHYMPEHWLGKAHTAEVRTQLLGLFRYKAQLFLEVSVRYLSSRRFHFLFQLLICLNLSRADRG